MERRKHKYLAEACSIAKGQASLSRLIGVSAPTVNQWLYYIRPIPPKRCLDIEKKTSVRCENLREDIDWQFLRTSVVSNTEKNHTIS